jgi:hypothetical protein
MKHTQTVSNRITRLFVVLAAVAGIACAGVTPKAIGQTGFTYNGIARAVYGNSDLGTSGDSTYVSFIQSTHANYVAITIEWFVQSNTGTTIAADSSASATDAQIIAAIQQYHALGIKVVLKPHVDIIGYPSWRGQLAPSSVSAWFSSYQAYITHYAQLSKTYGVDGLSIGTELKSLSGSNNLSFWQTLITAVRSDYSGPIMYGANATGSGDEYSTVSFWSLVDIIGVDGYFGLTNQDDPSVSQLEAAWTDSTESGGFNAVAALKNLNSQYGKPVVFTEVGYESSKGTNETPYAQISNGYDPTEQEDCYTAFFNVFSAQSSWMKGVFWWDLQLPVPGSNDQSWVMYGKPAGTVVLPQWFGGASSPSFTLSRSASSLSVTQGSSATDTITVTDVDGFTGSVSFTASGLPSGVTASFSPTSSTSSSVLTLTASSTATTGSSTVTVTGTSGSTTATTTIALTVGTGGSCTPTAIVPYISVNGGSTWTQESSATVSSTSTAVDLGPQPSSGGSWSWTGPNGYTATARQINSIPLSTGANNYVATYTNTSSCKSTQTFAITVSGSGAGFTLSRSASTLSVTQGSSATDTITVTDTGGFTGSVSFAASGLPGGVTASFSPTSSTSSSVLTLTASSTATVGSSTVTITGTSGSTTATTTIALTVAKSGTSGCTVDYATSPQGNSAFGATITIINGSTAITSWTLTWSFANGQTVSSLWNGIETQSGAAVTVKNEPYNGSIAANGTLTGIGFNGTWNGTTNAIPTAFSLNGTACTVN